jgi:hypothetical protein
MTSDPLWRLPAKAVEVLLVEMGALQDQARQAPMTDGRSQTIGAPLSPGIPDVTLLLDSGHSLTGSIVRVCAAPEALVLLRRQDAPMDVTYLPIGAIRAVTVHYSSENLHLLSSGQIKLASGPVPSRLDLERQVRALSAQLSGPLSPVTLTVAWDEMVQTDEAFRSLQPWINDLQAILLGIQADSLGAAALQQIDRIEIRFGTAQISRRERVLEIGLATAEGDLIVLSKPDLQQAIERLI